jgi:hypothetical protein
MVEIRVAVADPSRAHSLMLRLGGLFDPSSVTYDGARKQVRVFSEWESRGVAVVVDAVHRWLEDGGAESAELIVGEHSYELVASNGSSIR